MFELSRSTNPFLFSFVNRVFYKIIYIRYFYPFFSELTNDLLAAQIFIFFAAGFETSSSTISNALYELALNPDIQDKLRKEIKKFEAENNGEWKYETIKEMEYLEKVFQGRS